MFINLTRCRFSCEQTVDSDAGTYEMLNDLHSACVVLFCWRSLILPPSLKRYLLEPREHGWHFLIRIFVSPILPLSQPISVISPHPDLGRFQKRQKDDG